MLYLGAKVFLDSENPIFSFFNKRGASVYPIEELSNQIDRCLSSDRIEHNRSILSSYWGHDKMVKKTHDLILRLLDVVH